MRVRRLFLLLFLAYVVLDLGCPLVPGAFSFDPADSVDAVSADRSRPPAVPRVAVVLSGVAFAPPLAAPARQASEAPAALPLVGWRPHADRDRTLAVDSRPPAEDD